LLKALRDPLPARASRRLLAGVPAGDIFHALNQRVDFAAGPSSPRVVSTFHDLFVMTGEYSSPEFRARFAEQARLAAERSDAIITVSHFTAKHVETLLAVEPARIHVIPHGVHLPETIADESQRENLVLFAGVIQKRKNVARLVNAFSQMPSGWRLILAGATEGYGAQEELRAVQFSPRRADIEARGHISRAELDGLYQRARIFAFPSLDEGFGMPVLEAMAHGVPVVTSQISAMPEVAGDAALLVDPLDVEQIGSALRRIASDSQLRADLAMKGRERAREFSWQRAIEATRAIYDMVVPDQ
jgi:glycosyltransferase involved in cell wall biosynthesis